jgi:hypothetical protein
MSVKRIEGRRRKERCIFQLSFSIFHLPSRFTVSINDNWKMTNGKYSAFRLLPSILDPLSSSVRLCDPTPPLIYSLFV